MRPVARCRPRTARRTRARSRPGTSATRRRARPGRAPPTGVRAPTMPTTTPRPTPPRGPRGRTGTRSLATGTTRREPRRSRTTRARPARRTARGARRAPRAARSRTRPARRSALERSPVRRTPRNARPGTATTPRAPSPRAAPRRARRSPSHRREGSRRATSTRRRRDRPRTPAPRGGTDPGRGPDPERAHERDVRDRERERRHRGEDADPRDQQEDQEPPKDRRSPSGVLVGDRRAPTRRRHDRAARTSSATSVGVRPTRTPAASSASALAAAVPLEPVMIAPAWPIRLPGGAVKPAMYDTTGLRHALGDERRGPLLVVAPDLADHHHEIGPVSASKRSSEPMNPRPCTGSPPIPTQVDWPIPAA